MIRADCVGMGVIGEGLVRVWAHLRHVLHVLRRAEVLAEVDGVEAVLLLEIGVHRRAPREVVLRLGVHVPRQQTRRNGDLVLEHVELARGREEREDRAVCGVHVRILHVQAVHDRLRNTAAVLAEELGVAARAVTVGHDVLHHEDVLRLGDDRFEVARVVA